MATARPCLSQLSRLCISSPRLSFPSIATRCLSTTTPLYKAPPVKSKKKLEAPKSKGQKQKNKKKGEDLSKKKKKRKNDYERPHLIKDAILFPLLDAMRYIRAFEVGQDVRAAKYEMQIRFKTPKNGPIVRNRLRLPHPVKTDTKIAVICSPDSKYYELSKAAGAWIVGEDELFDRIREGKIDFDRCLCQTGSFEKLNKAGLGRILGPKGLMPTSRVGTVIMDPVAAIRDMTGGAEYRERLGVIQMAIGQLGFTPEELARNIKAAMESIKKDMNMLSEKVHKELAEVVLSSTNAPGFPLSGEMEGPETGITTRDLSTSA